MHKKTSLYLKSSAEQMIAFSSLKFDFSFLARVLFPDPGIPLMMTITLCFAQNAVNFLFDQFLFSHSKSEAFPEKNKVGLLVSKFPPLDKL